MKVGIYFFSGTGVTGQIATRLDAMINHLGIACTYRDITAAKMREEELEDFSFYIFGFPVYASVIPSVTREWITTLDGKGKHCAMFFTYGGVTIGIAHYHTKELLKKQGFKVVASAEFLGRHTFNRAEGFEFLPDRPNEEDFTVADEYSKKLTDMIYTKEFIEINIDKPEKYDGIVDRLKTRKKGPARIVPIRDVEDCRMCAYCEDFCATNAFNYVAGKADPMLCISCLHCATVCRDQVIVLTIDMSDIHNNLRNHYKLTDEILEQLQSKIFI